MISDIVDADKQREIFAARDYIIADVGNFSSQWLDNVAAKVIAAENLTHIAPEETMPLSQAFAHHSRGKLYAVTTAQGEDGDLAEDIVCSVEPCAEDFEALDWKFFGRFFLLFLMILHVLCFFMLLVIIS